MTKKRSSWKIVLTVIVFILLGYYLYKNQEVFIELRNLTVKDIIVVSILNVLMIATYAVLNKRMMDRIDKDVSYIDNFLMQYANNFLNKILPKGGAVFRGFYLKTVYNFPYSKFLSTVGGLYIITFISYSILGLISLLIIYSQTGLYNILVTLCFIGLLIGTTIVIIVNPKINREKNSIFKVLDDILEGWKTIKQYPKDILTFVLLNFVVLFLNTLKIYSLYNSLNLNLDFVRSLYLSTISVITMFLSFTPDGIGVNEAFIAFSSDVLGFVPEKLVFGSLISRAITTVISLLFGGICYFVLLHKAKNKTN